MEINGGCVYECFSVGGGWWWGGGWMDGFGSYGMGYFYFMYIFHFISINLGNEMENV